MATDGAPLEKGILKNLRYDFPSGVVVFLVALPLCVDAAAQQTHQGPAPAAYSYTEGRSSGLGIHLQHASGPAFEWQVRPTPQDLGERGGWLSLGVHPLDARGAGHEPSLRRRRLLLPRRRRVKLALYPLPFH